jgi:hypothetical protein
MKAIIYASVHHGNTKKVVEAIAKYMMQSALHRLIFRMIRIWKMLWRFLRDWSNETKIRKKY